MARAWPLSLVVLTILLTCRVGGAAPASFYREWRAELVRRLAEVVPFGPTQGTSQSGVAVREIARILGVSRPFVSQALLRPASQFTFAQLEKIAAERGIDRNWLIGSDLFARFAALEDFETAVRDERRAAKSLLRRIYLETRSAPSAGPFERRRRVAVNLRLSKLMPAVRGAAVSATALGEVIGRSRPAATQIINGPRHLTYDHAVLIGRRYGVDPEWLLATEMLDEFASAADLARALAGEGPAVRSMLTRIYAGRPRSCREDLAGQAG